MKRLLLTLVASLLLAFLIALSWPATLHAQTPALDSARVFRHEIDSLEHELSRIDSLKSRSNASIRAALKPTQWYAGALAAGVVANAVFGIDRDAGGYSHESWTSPDKWQHFSVAAFLVDRAAQMRVPLRWAVPLTCAAAVGFEYSQGHVSAPDAVVGCSGAAFAGAFRWIVRHNPKEQERR